MQRYFIQTDLTTQEFNLPAEVFHHAIKVMRNQVGAQLELVGPDQQVKVVELTAIEPEQAQAKLIETLTVKPELPVQVQIVCGISKGDKTEKIVQKGTELGAAQFIFYNSARSVAQWNAKKAVKKVDRLQKIAQGAAEQSHRVVVPEVIYCQSLAEVLAAIADANYRTVAYEESAKQGETSQLAQIVQQIKAQLKNDTQNPCRLAAFFGPEGGFTAEEVQTLQAHQVVASGLGPRIMRAETAPLYLLAALSFGLELA